MARRIFQSKVTGKNYDPIRVYRKLHEGCKNLSESFNDLWNSSALKVQMEDGSVRENKQEMVDLAWTKLAPVIIAAFGLSHVDDDQENGITEDDAFEMTRELFAFNEKKSDKPDSLPSSSPPGVQAT